MLQPDDPTIPDRLVIRALIEDGLPARAVEERWPFSDPADFARIIFDSVLKRPYEQLVSEPAFENFPAAKLKAAYKLALSLMYADKLFVAQLSTYSRTIRSIAARAE